MAVVLETTLGDITVDLYINERPKACLNFLKLCKIKYYNFNLFHTVNQGFIAQTGDPTGSRIGGESIWGVMEGPLKRYFEAENSPRIKHTITGLISFVGDKESMIGSQFFITLAPDLTYLDSQHCVFGEVTEGFEILRLLNEAICDNDHRPYQDIRITHTVVLEDPFPDPELLRVPDASPEPTAERLQGGRIAPDEEIDETMGKSVHEVHEIIAEKEAKARATILEMIGDIPDAEMAPPENVLFVCKLNPVTNDDDLEIIFSRFGKIKSCEVIRDKKTGDSLQYAFVEFEEQKSCEDAYFKMDNVLIDDRRIHVDFSQSVAKVKWHGKGRGITLYDDEGEKQNDDPKNNIGNGRYRKRQSYESPKREVKRERRSRSRDKYENGSSRNRFYNQRQTEYKERYDERYRNNRYRPNNRSRYDNYFRNRRNDYYEYRRDLRQENKKYPYRPRENERYRRNKPHFMENRTKQYDRGYYRRKEERVRSRSKDRFRQWSTLEEKENTRKEVEKVRKEYDDSSSSEEEIKHKKSKKKKKQSNDSDSEDSSPKKHKKSKKKKSKKKKKQESYSDSDSEESVKKSKKKKKKLKKYKSSSSDSDSDSDSDEPKKKKSKKYV